jgi:nucleoside-diphosphate-sugar epimerase
MGQIGSELTPMLRKKFGKENIVASDIRKSNQLQLEAGPFEIVDITDKSKIKEIVNKHDINTIYHLAAILSATGERNPQLAWKVNIDGLYNILEIARKFGVRVFHPSSIAVFGPNTPKEMIPQDTILQPTTIYGLTKVTGELLGNYYFKKYGVDIRGIRFPGVISNIALPGGGTTDYAVEMFYDAIMKGEYTCFVKEDTVLPMIYMPDCLKATLQLMETDISNLKHHIDFNVAGFSFSAGELAEEIRKYIPDFKVSYKPDYRQAIADSWPRSIDDSISRKEWEWMPSFDLESMTFDMLNSLKVRLQS